ncbi:MAG: hypothetical protein ACPGXY_02745 [Alphaproteobacteria bacterium]
MGKVFFAVCLILLPASLKAACINQHKACQDAAQLCMGSKAVLKIFDTESQQNECDTRCKQAVKVCQEAKKSCHHDRFQIRYWEISEKILPSVSLGKSTG